MFKGVIRRILSVVKVVFRRFFSIVLSVMLVFSTSGVTECFAENVFHEEIPAEQTVSGGEIDSGEDTEAALESVSGDEPAEDEAAVEPQAESVPDQEIPEDDDAVSDNDLSEDIEESAKSVSSDDTTTVSGDVFLPVEEESREPEIVGIFPSSAQRKYLVQIPAAPNNDLTCTVAYTFYDSSSPGKYDLYISSKGSNVPSTGFSNWSYNQSGIKVTEYTGDGSTTETTATLESLLNNTISIIGFSEKIKAIPANAFKNRKALQSVKFEGDKAGSTCQVTSIGASAFMGCTNLQTVDMSATTGLSEILGGSDGCFEGCTALKTVKLNNGLTGIGQNAFRNCSSLTEIDIPSSVTLIGWSAFLNSGLKKVTIRKRTSELSVALGAFNYCNSLSKILFYGTSSDKDTYIKIVADNNSQFLNESIWTYIDPDKMCGDNLTWSIVRSSTDSYYEYTLHISGEGAMYDYADSSQVPWKNAYNKERVCRIIIDEGVTSIGDYAFDYSACRPYETTSGSNQVTRCLSVSIPEGVQKIGKYAFNGQKNLYNIFLPKSVCDIRTGAFKDCANLQGICFWCTDYTLSIGSEAFSGCNRNMYFSFPKRVSCFGENAFKSLNNIKVYCPFGEYVYNNTTYTDDGDVLVKAIRNQGGSGAVYSGNYTGSEGKNKFFQSRYGFVGEVVPSSNGKKVEYELTPSGSLSIFGDGNMLSLNDPEYYPWGAGSGISTLTSVAVNNTNTTKVTGIGKRAFKNRTSINTIYLRGASSGTGMSIGDEAFYGCSNATFSPSNLMSFLGTIKDHAFYGCSKFNPSSASLTSSHTLTGDSQFSNCGLTRLTVDMGTKSIPQYAFSGCSKLTTLDFISAGNIGSYAFSGCTGLTTLTVTKSGDINSNAFYGCSKLGTLNILSAGNIIANAVSGLGSLTTLTVKNTTAVNANAFNNCSALTTATLENVSSVKSGAFTDCVKFATVNLNGTTVVSAGAFSGCAKLATVNHNGTQTLPAGALNGCSGLTTLSIGASADFNMPITDKPNNLKTLTVNSSNAKYAQSADNKFITNKDGNTLILGTKYTDIPDTVTTIGPSAFRNLTALTSITIPTSVVSIGDYALYNTGITTIRYPETKGYWETYLEPNIGSGNNPPIDTEKSRIVFASTEDDFGEGLHWKMETIEGGKKLIFSRVSGTSTEIPDFESSAKVPWAAFAPYITEVSVDTAGGFTVTGIGDYAFFGFKKLTYEKFSLSGLNSIGDYSFADCDALTAMPGGTYSKVGAHAFEGCDELTTVMSGITEIDEYAFAECPKLSTITTQNAITKVGDHAFENCTLLQNVYLSRTVVSVGEYAFAGSGAQSLEAKFTSIGEHAFDGCTGLAVAVIDCSGEIGDFAFKDCTGLTSITINGGESTVIGNNAFEDCAELASITFPGNAFEIKGGVVKGCLKLTEIKVSNPGNYRGNPDDNNILFKVDGSNYKIVAICPGVTTLDLSALNTITEIGDGAFAGGSFTSITLPESIVTIGDGAFDGCSNLTSFEVPKGVSDIGGGLFAGCTSLTEITVNAGNNDFSSTEAKDAILSKDGETFVAGCSATSMIPVTVTKIAPRAFYRCTGLTGMDIPSSIEEIGEEAFGECGALSKPMIIPERVKKIEKDLFINCITLPSVELPEGLEEIKEGAFYGCTALKTAVIPVTVTRIGEEAFLNCRNLTEEINLSGVENVGDGAFEGCESVGSVLLPATITDPALFGKYVFKNCTGIENIDFSTTLTFIPEGTFSGCTGIKSLVIGQSIETLGEGAFENANGFDTVLISKAVKTIGKNAFNGTVITKVNYPGTEAEWNAITIEDGNDVLLSAEKEYEWVVKIVPIGISISPSAPKAEIGKTLQLSVRFTPLDVTEKYKAVAWLSSDQSVATVDDKGMITAKKLGETKITVTTTSTDFKPLTAEAVLTVAPVSYTVTYKPAFEGETDKSEKVEEGTTIDLKADLFKRDGFTLSGWKDETGAAYAADQKDIVINSDKTFTAQWTGETPSEETTRIIKKPFTIQGAEGDIPIEMYVEITKTISYNGMKHVPQGSKVNKSTADDIVVTISGNILDYVDQSKTKIKVKNNKFVSSSGKPAQVLISFKPNSKDKGIKNGIKEINKALKNDTELSFEIIPLDLSTVANLTVKVNGKKTKVSKASGEVTVSGTAKAIKFGKKDFTAEINADAGTVILTGQGNCIGTATVPLP